jgi:hypothetical protein
MSADDDLFSPISSNGSATPTNIADMKIQDALVKDIVSRLNAMSQGDNIVFTYSEPDGKISRYYLKLENREIRSP